MSHGSLSQLSQMNQLFQAVNELLQQSILIQCNSMQGSRSKASPCVASWPSNLSCRCKRQAHSKPSVDTQKQRQHKWHGVRSQPKQELVCPHCKILSCRCSGQLRSCGDVPTTDPRSLEKWRRRHHHQSCSSGGPKLVNEPEGPGRTRSRQDKIKFRLFQ